MWEDHILLRCVSTIPRETPVTLTENLMRRFYNMGICGYPSHRATAPQEIRPYWGIIEGSLSVVNEPLIRPCFLRGWRYVTGGRLTSHYGCLDLPVRKPPNQPWPLGTCPSKTTQVRPQMPLKIQHKYRKTSIHGIFKVTSEVVIFIF